MEKDAVRKMSHRKNIATPSKLIYDEEGDEPSDENPEICVSCQWQVATCPECDRCIEHCDCPEENPDGSKIRSAVGVLNRLIKKLRKAYESQGFFFRDQRVIVGKEAIALGGEHVLAVLAFDGDSYSFFSYYSDTPTVRDTVIAALRKSLNKHGMTFENINNWSIGVYER